ncbi:MAG: outer membrane beta-barrel protein [Muribaculaceae bacterium]|nr:outer membrane beta-barrel protein [Muribaculaceae bacterium]
MKKFLIALVAVLGISTAASAQKTDLTISYGGYTAMDCMDYHGGGADVNAAWGALNVGVNFRVLPKFSIGPSYTFSSNSRKGVDDDHFYYHAIMLNGRYDYYRNSIVTISGRLGLGAVFSHESFMNNSKNRGHFGFQISPVNAYVSLSRGFGIFGEVGFGVQGLVQVGFRANL